MQSCPSCNSKLSERALYCASCGVQVRCKTCRDLLDPNARFCVSCGTPSGEGNSIQTERTNHGSGSSHNIIEFSEDAKSRHFRAEVSDTAINSVSQPLALFLGTRIGKQANRSPRQTSNLDDVIIEGADSVSVYDDDSHPVIEGAKALPISSDLEILRRIFRRTSDNKLKLSDSRLKQQDSQRDFVKRLTVLFLFAHELEGQEAVPRTDLNAALSDAKVYDSNARTWMNNTNLIDIDENSIRLTVPGRDYARKVLGEYLDPQIEGTWSLESKNRRRVGKGRNSEKREETEEGSKARKGRRARSDSYTAKVRMLFDSDFFAEGRTGKEVQAELERKGFKFELKRIKEALLKLTQKDNLTRKPDESNDWVYKNG